MVFMMSMDIKGGSLEINDDNTVSVSGNIAEEIKDSYIQPDGKEEKTPQFTIKD